jgi:pSer/pThr/pTyr-binding forkhead associated (FHA) protein
MPRSIYIRKKHNLNVKTIGREASCDLVIEHSSASRQHASIELSEDGSVWVVDADSRNGMFLNRNDAWIRVRRVTLCVGDRIRFGDHETPLHQLTAVFGKRASVSLGEQHFPLRQGERTNKKKSAWDDPGPSLQKPQRNPLTGRIEEEHL